MRKIYGTLIFTGLFFFAANALAAVGDHVYLFDMWYGVDYTNPLDSNDIDYRLSFEIQTDDTVEMIEFLTPAGNTYQIPNLPDNWDEINNIWTNREFDDESGNWYWEYTSYNADYNDLDRFGDGVYTFTFYYSGDTNETTTVRFLVPDTNDPIPQPMHKPEFINPRHRSSTPSSVTLLWQECTDANTGSLWVSFYNNVTDYEIGDDLPKNQTSYGPFSIDAGYWDAEVGFDRYYGILNDDGIEAWMGKSRYATISFAVDTPWIAYEVWAGNTDYRSDPLWQDYYHNIDQYDYIKLGESANSKSITVSGNYTYYVIASHEPVMVDAAQGSNGTYYYGGLSTGGTENWNEIKGEPNSVYAQVGTIGFDGSFCGFARLTNPGDWTGLTVITNLNCSEPLVGDLDGDCRVNFTDFAIMSENWLKCNLIPQSICW
ncbi:MAG: hypothetical protein PHP01_09675 [Phycisphaerae bacterium]|nr:hypothetical protein [Phycisphaerae bacterium]